MAFVVVCVDDHLRTIPKAHCDFLLRYKEEPNGERWMGWGAVTAVVG